MLSIIIIYNNFITTVRWETGQAFTKFNILYRSFLLSSKEYLSKTSSLRITGPV